MNKFTSVNTENIKSNERGNRNQLSNQLQIASKVVSLIANQNGEDGTIDYDQNRESAPFHKDSAMSGSRFMGERNTTGETPMLETAETLKHTLENTATQGMMEYQTIESVRDFPNYDGAVIRTAQMSISIQNHQNNHLKTQTSSSIDHLQSVLNEAQRHFSESKNFVSQNLKSLKTFKEIKAERANLRKQRAEQVLARKNSNPYGYKFFGLKESKSEATKSFQQVYRSQEWNKIIVMNNELEKLPRRHTGLKNSITNKAFEEPVVKEIPCIESIMTGFTSTKRQAAYQTRNQSSINMLRSFRTLEFDSKDAENDLIPETLGSVSLAQNLNRNSQLDQPTYGRVPMIPDEYQSFQSKKEIIHNAVNRMVSEGRLRNGKSTFISEM